MASARLTVHLATMLPLMITSSLLLASAAFASPITAAVSKDAHGHPIDPAITDDLGTFPTVTIGILKPPHVNPPHHLTAHDNALISKDEFGHPHEVEPTVTSLPTFSNILKPPHVNPLHHLTAREISKDAFGHPHEVELSAASPNDPPSMPTFSNILKPPHVNPHHLTARDNALVSVSKDEFGHPQYIEPTVTSPDNLESVPAVTMSILRPPRAKPHRLTARDAQTTGSITPSFSLKPKFSTFTTTTTTTAPGPVTTTITVKSAASQPTAHSLLLLDETETSVASSTDTPTSALRDETEATSDSAPAPTETDEHWKWECKGTCGELDDDGNCTVVAGCVDMESNNTFGEKSAVSSTGSASLSGHYNKKFGMLLMLELAACLLV
jgi:hypothetical protein